MPLFHWNIIGFHALTCFCCVCDKLVCPKIGRTRIPQFVAILMGHAQMSQKRVAWMGIPLEKGQPWLYVIQKLPKNT